ncbi:hypothetical protein [Serratia fonticola]|uniref:hypothetical protein n=1 Tax=Serratia fonticola TaxID=47917 RepID=UPI0013781411|nr:hypothetical protein [Serratia fonticola]NCG55161.1 hypothetical protein [Serratia fonticola]
MTISTERVAVIRQFLTTGGGWNDRATTEEFVSIIDELIAARSAVSEPVASCIVADGLVISDGFSEYENHNLSDGHHELFTAQPAPAAPQSDHLKRALKLAGEAKELADRIRAEELALQTPVVPDDVAAALDWIDDFIARCNGDDRGSCNSVNILRRAMLKSSAHD